MRVPRFKKKKKIQLFWYREIQRCHRLLPRKKVSLPHDLKKKKKKY